MLEGAQRDGLTGFFAREALNPFLEKLIAQNQESGATFSTVLIDLDHFKKFNDKLGHLFGDEILKYATSTLRLTFYEGQCRFFRYGGDEFIAVFPEKEPKETLQLMHQCHYNLRRRPCLFENKFYRVTISCGIAGFPLDASSAEELIQKADAAMYFSKHVGRNYMTLFSKISYLKLCRIFTIAGIILGAIAIILAIYGLTFKKIIKPTISQIQHMKIITRPKNLDTVILKDGTLFEGRIMSETEDCLTLNIYFDNKGEGLMTLKKPEIAQIKRSQ